MRKLVGSDTVDFRKPVGELVAQGAAWLGTFIQGLWSGGRALISLFAVVIVMPIVAFYVLVDWHRMVNKVNSWLPVRHRETIRGLAREIDDALAGFIRGQAFVIIFLGCFYAVALSLVGLNFAFLIGFGAGLLSFIPYVGSMTGLLISGGVAFAQFWPDWVWIAVVLRYLLRRAIH